MPTVYHIPVCPFSQRLEILLALKGRKDLVNFQVVDITRPRPDWLLEKSRGTTALPILETAEHLVLKESLVILQYLEDITPEKPVAQMDPARRAVENMLVGQAGVFADAGYLMLLNQDLALRPEYEQKLLAAYRRLNDFLTFHAPAGDWLFDAFGWAEVVFTPLFMRFWFLEYYEGFVLPRTPEFSRIARWQEVCRSHPAAQQVTREQIVKLYYDYAKGAGNGSLVPGRQVSSFVFDPAWEKRPWPNADKYAVSQTDQQLGLR